MLPTITCLPAVTPVTTCTVINTPGTYVLQNDILDSSANICINISSSDVTFDGNDYTIDGTDTTSTYGIYVYDISKTRQNITIKNVTLTDWGTGLYYKNGDNSTIDRVNVSSSKEWEIQFEYVHFTNITRNTITTSLNYHAITFGQSNHNIISNNILKDNGYPSSSKEQGSG